MSIPHTNRSSGFSVVLATQTGDALIDSVHMMGCKCPFVESRGKRNIFGTGNGKINGNAL